MAEGGTLEQQIRFLMEIDKLKSVERRSPLMDGSRHENSAEHSWHVAVMALVLAPYATDPIVVDRVVMMLLVHDIVEIDAGDTFAYDSEGRVSQPKRERQAAERLFGLLPLKQGDEYRGLWEEFERAETAESRFANAIDRFMPLLHNYRNQGGTWKAYGIDRQQVLERVGCIEDGSATVWDYARTLVDDAVEKGYLRASPDSLRRQPSSRDA